MATGKLILVNRKNQIVGCQEKKKCHLGKGILHRAFSIYVFNNKNQLLIQRRSRFKPLWPFYWSNTCCSHPLEGENYKKTLRRRLKQEVGFVCPLQLVERFYYHARYRNIGSERELCDILIGKYNGEVSPNPKEVDGWQWAEIKELKKDIKNHPGKYTPWFKIGLPKVEKWLNKL